MPKSLILGIVTLLLLSLLTLVLNTGVGGGAVHIGRSAAPLADGFRAVFGRGEMTNIFTFCALRGLIASFHTTIYAYGRVLFALSRAGYFPRWISRTCRFHTPHLALMLGGAIGLTCTATIRSFGEQSQVGGALLNMAVFGAVISYSMVMVSYIKLKIQRPDLPRPYQSPLGIPGAVVGAALSVLALFACFSRNEYRPGVWGVAIFLGVAILYFLIYSRKRLVAKAPEEEVALVAEAERGLVHQ